MTEETVEQIKTKQLIDLQSAAIHLAQVNNFPPLIIGGMQAIFASMANEYNEKYFPESIIKKKEEEG